MKNPVELIMIRPANFGFNSETAQSNHFQNGQLNYDSSTLAITEFDNMVSTLRNAQLSVTVFEDTKTPLKPDAIFPNNWISAHEDGTIVLYPMEAENRRIERREDVINFLKTKKYNTSLIDLTEAETQTKYLEGTGSIIFDSVNRDAYACISSRTDVELFEHLCKKLIYNPISFISEDAIGNAIYHTNVMLSIGEHIIVICSESIPDLIERAMVLKRLKASNRTLIDVSFRQMNQFCCNCIEVDDIKGNSHLIMSLTAYKALRQDQIEEITKTTSILPVDIHTIETIGGGSARCMILGVLPLQSKGQRK